jgi:hypothetical protein
VQREGEDAEELRHEARLFGRYLVGRLPPPALLERYVDANRLLLRGPLPRTDTALVAFVRRHPWSVGCLDAAAAWLRPTGLLRNKILILAAILESSPDFADEFLPRAAATPALVWRVAAAGLRAGLQLVVGSLLYLVTLLTGVRARRPSP